MDSPGAVRGHFLGLRRVVHPTTVNWVPGEFEDLTGNTKARIQRDANTEGIRQKHITQVLGTPCIVLVRSTSINLSKNGAMPRTERLGM